MKKEIYYCDLCGKEMNNVNYIKVPTNYKIQENLIIKYSKWQTKEICNSCIKPIYDIFQQKN